MKRTFAVVAALIATLSLAMPATGIAGKSTKVKVEDDFFSPTKLTVKQDTKVAFKWQKDNLNTHNVTMTKGPKGVKKTKKPCAKGDVTKCNKSASGSIGINFAPTFNKKGSYTFVCTIHPTVMKINVKVTK
ncbi:MAG: plastocyanin/azurin family copper-binding protein [Solirubrobacterales bacterium]